MNRRIQQWSLQQIAEEIDGRPTGDGCAAPPGSVSSDTRSLEPGALFVALVGERFDGHDYVAQAAELGACGAIVSRPVAIEAEVPFCQIVVDDTLVGLQMLGRAVFCDLADAGTRSIALTGSNGKTTTKELIRALWAPLARVHATVGNLNNHIGVPLTLCDAPAEVDVIVLEMGANGFGDLTELVEIADADVRVITSIGSAHLEGFGGIDGVRRAKSEIFGNATTNTVAVVPVDEVDSLELDGFPGAILTVGPNDSAADVEYQQNQPGRVRVHGEGFEYDLKAPLPGEHNAHNLATAFATLIGSGQKPELVEVREALEALRLPGGRWREVVRGDWRVLDDAYNANPSSVRASWDAFAEIVEADPEVETRDVIAVIGVMLELGDDAESMHAETAADVARRGGAGTFVFVGPFADVMARAARSQGAAAEAFETPADAAGWLAEREPGLVYLKASRGQKLERLIEELPD